MEGKEFYLKEGVITEMKYDEIRKTVKNASKSQLDEGLILQSFLINSLKNIAKLT